MYRMGRGIRMDSLRPLLDLCDEQIRHDIRNGKELSVELVEDWFEKRVDYEFNENDAGDLDMWHASKFWCRLTDLEREQTIENIVNGLGGKDTQYA